MHDHARATYRQAPSGMLTVPHNQEKMKSKTIGYFLMLLIPISSICQTDYRISYYPYINDAELAIIDSNFRLALENYKRAFNLVEIGFGRDYHNAALCAIELEEFDIALKYLNKLASKGIEKEYFEKNKNTYSKLYGKGFEEFLDGFEELQKSTFQQTVNYDLIGKLGEMENKDQEFRYDYKLFQDTIQKIDAENISKLVDLVDRYGFPSEEMLGLQSPYADRVGYHYIIWHHLKNWKSDTTLIDIRPIILDAVKDGQLSPEQAADYFNISESRVGGVGNFGNTGVIRFNDDIKFYILDYKDENLVNQNRKELGLCNLEDLEEKLRFHFIKEKRKSRFEVLKLGGIDQYPSEAKSIIDVKELK